MNYIPPCIYSLPPSLADRICAQGVSNTITALTAQVAATAPGGAHPDVAGHATLNGYLTKITAAKAAGQ